MNDRIKQLADQAQQYAEHTTPQGLEWFPAFKEKFAELIVRECSRVAKLTETDDGDDYKSGRTWAGDDVLKHFGIEE